MEAQHRVTLMVNYVVTKWFLYLLGIDVLIFAYFCLFSALYSIYFLLVKDMTKNFRGKQWLRWDLSLTIYCSGSRNFSSCSAEDFEKLTLNKGGSCLLNIPKPDEAYSAPSCGNKLVDPGEECDCGTPKVSKSSRRLSFSDPWGWLLCYGHVPGTARLLGG